MQKFNGNTILAGIGFILIVTFFSYQRFHRYDQGLAVVVTSDSEGYHQYLTALFIKGDILDQPFAYVLEDGTYFNKYNYGVAFLQLPVFLTAHAIAQIFDLPAKGKVTPYVFSVIVSGAFYIFMGLLLIFRILKGIFSKRVSWLTIIGLFLGTNLLYYGYRDPGASHAYAFFLTALFIYGVELFYKRPALKSALLIAIPIGIISLIRITHITLLLYLVLYGATNWKTITQNLAFLLKYRLLLLLIPLSVILFYIPQILYWHATTGHFFVNPYDYSLVEEGFFNWSKPKFGLVLFGPVGGWLLITPLMLFALHGMYLQFKQRQFSPFATIIILLITTYVYASWWHPTLAGSYGHRGFVDLYPILAIPMAFSFQQIIFKSKTYSNILVGLVVLLLFINIHLSYLYNYWWWDVEWTYVDFAKIMGRVFFIPTEVQTFP